MFKRKAEEEGGQENSCKVPKIEDSDNEDYEDEDSGSDDGKKYEILKEDDIEGQEAGEITKEGDVQITPFNMKEEMEEGHFDADGMYHWNKEANVRDNWLENIDWVKIKDTDGAAEKQKSESEEESKFDRLVAYKQMLQYMKERETVATALRRLGGTKSLSASERLKMKKAGIVIDKNDTGDREAVTKLTGLADSILTNMGNMDIYQETYEEITEKVNDEANSREDAPAARGVPDLDMYADDFDEKEKAGLDATTTTKSKSEDNVSKDNSETNVQWEFKKELTDEKTEGPYSTTQMNKWIHENHFKTQVWVRRVGSNSEFYSSKRIDFELYL